MVLKGEKEMKKASILSLMCLLCNCAGNISAAKVSVEAGRAATKIVGIGMAVAYETQQKECLKKGTSDSESYKACMKSAEEREAIWKKSEDGANKVWDIIEVSLKAAESVGKGETVDWMSLAKEGICFLTKVFAFIPKKYTTWAQVYIDLMGGLTCK